MGDSVTYSEYYTECETIARDAVLEAEGDRDRAHELARETVDGHQWIIYTARNLEVLTHSSNDGAYFDAYGSLEADSFSDAVQKMAYAAMEQDVAEYVETAIGEWVSDDDIESLAQDCARESYKGREVAPWGAGDPLPPTALEAFESLVGTSAVAARRAVFDKAFREHHADMIEANEES